MSAKLQSWWQQIKQHPFVTGIVVLLVLILFIFLAYWFDWDWTGFNSGTSKITITSASKVIYTVTVSQPEKALWDWLTLLGVLAIPAVVGIGAAWYTTQQEKVSEKRNTDNQREIALQTYIDKMSDLLLHAKLRKSREKDDVRNIAHVRTLTILARLDGNRKKSVLQILYESGLIEKGNCIVNLSRADLRYALLYEASLSNADLRGVDLLGAELEGAKLEGANLRDASLYSANLKGANLRDACLSAALLNKADLTGARLEGADLSKAILLGANFTKEQLDSAKSLVGATMPDGSILEGLEFNELRSDVAGLKQDMKVVKAAVTVCPVCHRSDQVKKLQAAYEAGIERFAPPKMPTGTVSMLKFMVAAVFLVAIGAFFIFVLVGSGGTGFISDLIQVLITLAAIVTALILSFLAFVRILRGDEESRQLLPAYDHALENYRRHYYCSRDNVVFDPQTNKTLSDAALRSLLSMDTTGVEQSQTQSQSASVSQQ